MPETLTFRATTLTTPSAIQRSEVPGLASLAFAPLLERYRTVRAWSESLCAPLQSEDYVVQSMPDCSPTKWHLAHTSWFFETFLLQPEIPEYQSLHPQYNYLFNSYYNAIGERHCRPRRGLLSRPTVSEVFAYRAYIDEHIERLLRGAGGADLARLAPLFTLGLHHEQQHQELLVTDIKNVFAANPLQPVYQAREHEPARLQQGLRWQAFDEGLHDIGYAGDAEDGFCFDNEIPRHRVWLNRFELASRLVTCGEYQQFMLDGGYSRPELWLSAGWNAVQDGGWQAPLYWEGCSGDWRRMTLGGLLAVELAQPVTHVSYFEADAYARWVSTAEPGTRLPTEAEWEVAAAPLPISGQFAENSRFEAEPAAAGEGLSQMYGEAWQWTQSQYSPYPGYAAAAGALGEYNGKFMCNQFVLRGGSCATPRSHIRATYRNFFAPEARWQYSGIRLARVPS